MAETPLQYKNINLLTPTPTGGGGSLLINNDKALADQYQGAWSASTAYPVNSIVRYSGSTFIATSANGPTATVPVQGSSWDLIAIQTSTAPVTSVASRTGAIVLTASDIGGLGSAATTNSTAYDAAGSAAAVQTNLTNAVSTLNSGLSGALLKSNNLSDLANASTARTNLGLGSAATTSSTAYDAAGAAGTVQTNLTNAVSTLNSSLTNYLARANNLSDLGNISTARTNLGLNNVVNSLQLTTANNLSDLTNVATARTNLGLGSIATHAATDYLAVGATIAESQVTNLVADLGSKAPTNNPVFTGTLTLPTGTVAYGSGGNLDIDATNGIDLYASGGAITIQTTGTGSSSGSITLSTQTNITLQPGSGAAVIVSSGIAATGTIGASDYTGIVETIGITVDGGGALITTGSKGYRYVDHNYTIVGWTIVCDQSGSVAFGIGSCTYSAYPTSTSIVASAAPSVSSATKNQSSTLTGWTTSLIAGTFLQFNISSVSTVQTATLILRVVRA